MSKVEQGRQAGKYSCDLCAVKDEGRRIIGGKFCMRLSVLPGCREVFQEERFSSRGHRLFWSCQEMQNIEDCDKYQEIKRKQNVSPEPVVELV